MLIRFVGEIFPPYICTHGPGEDPFEAVMCAVGAASQISYLLIEDSIFNTKYHLDLCRISKYKVYYQALQLQEGLLKRFNLEVSFFNGKKTLIVEMFQANKFISFLEWGYRPVGGSLCLSLIHI